MPVNTDRPDIIVKDSVNSTCKLIVMTPGFKSFTIIILIVINEMHLSK